LFLLQRSEKKKPFAEAKGSNGKLVIRFVLLGIVEPFHADEAKPCLLQNAERPLIGRIG
jgi:hypothetical protein